MFTQSVFLFVQKQYNKTVCFKSSESGGQHGTKSGTLTVAQNIHRDPTKGATKLMVVTSSNLNRFSIVFTTRKRIKLPIKSMYYFPSCLTYIDTLPLRSKKFKCVANLEQNANKNIT